MSHPLRRRARERVPPQLRGAQETLIAPLHARAVDAGRALPLLGDRWARRLVDRLDYDFTRLRAPRCPLGAVVRTAMFDVGVRGFLSAHPAATVVELGAGLNTRFERLDNGHQRWFDVDLPEVTALRRGLLPTSSRRRHLAASITDPHWLDEVAASPGPHCCVLEAVLGYLPHALVQPTLARIAHRLPGALIGLDVFPRWNLAGDQLVPDASAGLDRPDIAGAIERWAIGLTLIESSSFLAASSLHPRDAAPRPAYQLAWFRTAAPRSP